MVYDIQKTVNMHGIPHDGGQLVTTVWGGGFRDVNDWQFRPIHCREALPEGKGNI